MDTNSIVKVGDSVCNEVGVPFVVTSVDRGRHGLLVKGTFANHIEYRGFLVPELPVVDEIINWYGWLNRDSVTLKTGSKLSSLGFRRDDPRPRTIEEYDAEWERTPKDEPMQSRPTKIRMEG